MTFEEAVDLIRDRDPRYARDAYLFVREALDFTQKALLKDSRSRPHYHVSPQELLAGIRDYAVAQFGPMAITVLDEWGIRRCEDFGEMVFQMVDIGILRKTDNDRPSDFAGVYDFEEAFRKPFLPSGKLAPEAKPVKVSK